MVERRYWDSDCFLGWLQNEPGKVEPCGTILSLCDRGEIEIVTSVLTLTEVLRLRPREALPAERRSAVEALFNRRSIHTMMLTRHLAEQARDLAWDHDIAPKDAIHVASALAAKVRMLDTFDVHLIRKSGQIGTPPLTIAEPFVTEPELDLEQPEAEAPDPT